MNDLLDIQKAHVIALQKLLEITRKNNIKIYPIYGTLLGIVRHGGFIPWDDDIDVAVMEKDFHKLVKILIKETKSPYVIWDKLLPWSEGKVPNPPNLSFTFGIKYKGGVYTVDIFRVTNVKNPLKYPRKMVLSFGKHYVINDNQKGVQALGRFFLKFVGKKHFNKQVVQNIKKYTTTKNTGKQIVLIDDNRFMFDAAIFAQTKKINFEGLEWEMPIDPIPFLEAAYGDWKKIPTDKQKQKALHYTK